MSSAVPHASSKARISSRDMAQIAVFAALIAALGLPGTITVGISGVPITLQTLGVILAGALLGARKGTLAVAVFLLLAVVGLPVLASRTPGLTALAGPSAGYLVGWLFAAALIGYSTSKILPKYPIALALAINVLGGIVVIYIFGIAGLLIRTDLGFVAAITTNFAFVPGDLIKVVIAAVVAKGVHRAYPGLMRRA